MKKGGACSQMRQPKRVATENVVQDTELFTVAILSAHVVRHRVEARSAPGVPLAVLLRSQSTRASHAATCALSPR